MAILNQNHADTLCTIIACGFIKRETEKPSGQKKTVFIYEKPEDKNAHNTLAGILNSLKNTSGGKAIASPVEIRQQKKKNEFPFILAQTGYIPDAVANGLVGDLNSQVLNAETTINKDRTENLPGAYIGGLSTVNSIVFCGGSDLFQYSPEYRDDLSNTHIYSNIKKAYENAQKVSNILANELPKFKGKYKGINWRVEDISSIDASYAAGRLFASVHGMTRSITTYYVNSDKQKVFLELALGADTSKVASCVPCSIFMSACGTPATATHLGRGDNWNFPERMRKNLLDILAGKNANVTTTNFSEPDSDAAYPPVSLNDMLVRWCREVNSCYLTGLELLKDNEKVHNWNLTLPTTSAGWQKQIPGLFLEALTYECSFMNRMKSTLNIR